MAVSLHKNLVAKLFDLAGEHPLVAGGVHRQLEPSDPAEEAGVFHAFTSGVFVTLMSRAHLVSRGSPLTVVTPIS